MKKYYSDASYRFKTQIALYAVQTAVMLAAITLMFMFLAGTPVGILAFLGALFTLVWLLIYIGQAVFAAVSHGKIQDKNKNDKIFLIACILFIAAGIIIFGLLMLFV